ncbi:hypothetical protein BN1723_016340, partial [Verticillium longisporum]
ASEGDEDDRKEWHGTSVLVLNGISELLASYLNVLSKHPSFNNLWQELLAHFTTLLDFKILDVSTATFKALGQILAQGQPHHKSSFGKETVDTAWQLWSRGIPVAAGDDGTKNDNQNCLTAYVGAFHDVYRLVSADLTVERVRQMLTLFREALQRATVGAYVNDVEYTTPLQNQVLEAIKTIRTDLEGVPSAMISQVAEFVRLPFNRDPAREGASKRTYVAMSKGSMAVLQRLVLIHAGDADVYASGAFSAALSALSKAIILKYRFPIVTKSTQPWRLATDSTLAVLEGTLPHLHTLDVPKETIPDIWRLIVDAADGIISADSEAAPDKTDILDDEAFDIKSFRKLRELIIPSLGAEVIPDKTRKAYAESLFRTSMIHTPPPGDSALGADGAGLSAMYKPRKGRTSDPTAKARSKMSYVCLEELFSLHITSLIRRILRCAADLAALRHDGVTVRRALELSRSIAAGAWECDTHELQQVANIGPKKFEMLEAAGILTVRALADTEFYNIDRILKRNPPFGMNTVLLLKAFPRLLMKARFERWAANSDMPAIDALPEKVVRALAPGLRLAIVCVSVERGPRPESRRVFAGRRVAQGTVAPGASGAGDVEPGSRGELLFFHRVSTKCLMEADRDLVFPVAMTPGEAIFAWASCEEVVGTLVEMEVSAPEV